MVFPNRIGSCCLLNGSPGARNLRRQTSLPAKSQQPISPEQLKNQTCLPSVTGVQEVASLYAYIRGLAFSPVSFTDQRILPVFAFRQWPRMVALNLGVPSLY